MGTRNARRRILKRRARVAFGTGPPRQSREQQTRERQTRFLQQLAVCDGNITMAARQTGMSRMSHYRWRDHDPTYRSRFRAVIGTAGERTTHRTVHAVSTSSGGVPPGAVERSGRLLEPAEPSALAVRSETLERQIPREVHRARRRYRACLPGGRVGRSTVYGWKQHDSAFRKQYDAARQVLLDELESTLVAKAKDDNQLLRFTLERRFPETYGRRLRLDREVATTALDRRSSERCLPRKSWCSSESSHSERRGRKPMDDDALIEMAAAVDGATRSTRSSSGA